MTHHVLKGVIYPTFGSFNLLYIIEDDIPSSLSCARKPTFMYLELQAVAACPVNQVPSNIAKPSSLNGRRRRPIPKRLLYAELCFRAEQSLAGILFGCVNFIMLIWSQTSCGRAWPHFLWPCSGQMRLLVCQAYVMCSCMCLLCWHQLLLLGLPCLFTMISWRRSIAARR